MRSFLPLTIACAVLLSATERAEAGWCSTVWAKIGGSAPPARDLSTKEGIALDFADRHDALAQALSSGKDRKDAKIAAAYEEDLQAASRRLQAEGFEVKRIPHEDGSGRPQRDLLAIVPSHSNTVFARTLKSAHEKLDVTIHYDPLIGVVPDRAGYGVFDRNVGVVLSFDHFAAPETDLNTNILHELRHAHLSRNLSLGRPSPYYGDISSRSRFLKGLNGYESFLSFEEMSTTQKDLEHVMRSGRIKLLRNSDKRLLIEGYAVRLRKISEAIQQQIEGVLERMKTHTQAGAFRVDEKASVNGDRVYARLALPDATTPEAAFMDVYLLRANPQMTEEEKEAVLKDYLLEVLAAARKHAQAAEAALQTL